MEKKPCAPSAKYHVGAAPAVAFSVCAPYPDASQLIVRSTTIGSASVEVTIVANDRRFEAGDLVSVNRRLRRRRQRAVLHDRRAVLLQERDHHRRRGRIRIREQDVGVEERAGRAFRQIVGALRHGQRERRRRARGAVADRQRDRRVPAHADQRHGGDGPRRAAAAERQIRIRHDRLVRRCRGDGQGRGVAFDVTHRECHRIERHVFGI